MCSKALLIVLFSAHTFCFAQSVFESEPEKAQFITSDIPNFWKAYDQMDAGKKPFREYLENGSLGLRDFIKYRIESPNNLLKTVKERKQGYDKIREESYNIEYQTDKIRSFYTVFKELYDEAIFPPTYFVIGAFNSGGTSSENGLIIGVETQNPIDHMPYIVAHELVHFNQHYPDKTNLLQQSIKEGCADFIGELISGKQINEVALEYFNKNESQLCSEFVKIMNDNAYHGWLYGGHKIQDGRPNDLGYAIGYKICANYYATSVDKKLAVKELLNINNFEAFLTKSGYISKYL